MIDVAGISKAKLVAALHAGARAIGLGVLHDKGPLSESECSKHIALATRGDSIYFDYLRGRLMKIDVGGDQIDEVLYDRDNGAGAAACVVARLRRV